MSLAPDLEKTTQSVEGLSPNVEHGDPRAQLQNHNALPSAFLPQAFGQLRSWMTPVCLKTLQWHAGPEPVVLTADSIKLGSHRLLHKRAKLLADDAEQTLSKDGIGLRVTHFSDPSP